MGSATAYVDADVKQPSPQADVDVKVEKRGFGDKVKGMFSHKDAKGGVAVAAPAVEGDVSGEGKVGAEMAVDVPAGAELRLPSAELQAGGSTSQRRPFEPDVGVRPLKPGDRPHSSVEGDVRLAVTQPRSEGLRTGSLERHTAHRPDLGARLSWSLKRKPKKPKKSVETALRMGLPIVSVAAGNFGDSRRRSKSTSSSSSSSSSSDDEGKKKASVG